MTIRYQDEWHAFSKTRYQSILQNRMNTVDNITFFSFVDLRKKQKDVLFCIKFNIFPDNEPKHCDLRNRKSTGSPAIHAGVLPTTPSSRAGDLGLNPGPRKNFSLKLIT